MHWPSLLLRAAALAAAVSARAVPPTHRLHEKREISHPRLQSRMEPDAVLPMRIGLKSNPQALASAESWLMEVSHPASPGYGKHWTQEAVIEAFSPTNETVDAVTQWLVNSGIAEARLVHSDNKGWVAFDATVQEAEDLLHTTYFHDGGEEGDRALVGCDEYHLPHHIQEHVDYVTPGVKGTVMDVLRLKKLSVRSSRAKQQKKRSTVSESAFKRSRNARQALKSFPRGFNESWLTDLSICDQVLTPACVRALYDFDAPQSNAPVSPRNTLGIYEEADYYDQLDLDTFFARFTPQIPNGTHPKLDSVDGGVAPLASVTDDGGESLLDFSVAYPIIYPQKITLYQVDDQWYAEGGLNHNTTTGVFNTFLDALDGSYCTYSAYGETGDDPKLDPVYPDTQSPADEDPYLGPLMCGVYKPTNIISISYGVYEQDLPYAYQERQCNEYLKLALQGTSVIIASGDTGVGGYPYGTYGNLPYYGCLGPDDNVFTPSQACSCPWVTNLGATEVYPGKTVRDPEAAAQWPSSDGFNYSSSGGFSNIFPIPAYQAGAVAAYFRDSDPPYPYYYDGRWQEATNGGVYNRNGRGIPDLAANGDNYPVAQDGEFYTSGGTSQSAPLFASLLNRIIEERLKIGKGAVGFINPVLYAHPEVLTDITEGDNPGCGTSGFSAVPGWDPVTGLGTPNYPKMLELFKSLP